jgi:hypothetical protein
MKTLEIIIATILTLLAIAYIANEVYDTVKQK